MGFFKPFRQKKLTDPDSIPDNDMVCPYKDPPRIKQKEDGSVIIIHFNEDN